MSSGAEVVGAEGRMEEELMEDREEDREGIDTIDGVADEAEEAEEDSEVCCDDWRLLS